MKPRDNMTEAEFKNVVISIAKRYGWLIHHDLPAQNARGKWATHIQGDAGFPDLLMVLVINKLLKVYFIFLVI